VYKESGKEAKACAHTFALRLRLRDVIAESSHDGRSDIAYRVPRLLSGKWGMAYLSKITVDSNPDPNSL